MACGFQYPIDPVTAFFFEDDTWRQAATLAERMGLLRSKSNSCAVSSNGRNQAAARMARWRALAPFTDAAAFSQRLASEGITEDEFLGVLGEPAEDIHTSSRQPGWLAELSQAFSNPQSPRKIQDLVGTSKQPSEQPGEQHLELLTAIAPLITHTLHRLETELRTIVRACSNLPIDVQSAGRILAADLTRRLFPMVGRTLVLELNVARLEGRLEGDTSEQRFHSFVQLLQSSDVALRIMREYPVLARQLVTRLDQWVDAAMEFFQRLCADWDLIRGTFSPHADLGTIVQIRADEGDRHRSGRSVWIAKFSSGFQLVYKPKPMAVDVHFQELLNWINQRGNHPAFRTIRVADRGVYGWSEFVPAAPCDSVAALRRFYKRQGGYLALLYMLEATDFHCENLIAAGENPVLIDLEALFHPRHPAAEEDIEATTVVRSVFRIGLLPWRNGHPDSIDVSGLGAAAGQISPYPSQAWENVGTDEMRLVRKRMAMPGAENRPTLNGTDVDPCRYTKDMLGGFTSIYRLLVRHCEDLLASDGPLQRFVHDEVRVVLRATNTYASLLAESFHPDVLRDALDRDQLFDRLWMAVEHRPYLAKVIRAEREDLHEGDVPIFTARPAERDLWTSTNERIRDFFDEPAMTLVARRLRHLDDRDLRLQIWIIRASLATLAKKDHASARPAPRSGRALKIPRKEADALQLLNAARAVGDRLESMAVRTEKGTFWIGLKLDGEERWSLSTTQGDLYEGLPGIALFLGYLGGVTGNQRYTDLAQACCATMLDRLEKWKSSITSIGGFSGWGGIIYALTHLTALWDRSELLNRAEGIVEFLPGLIEQDQSFDIIVGMAGCIGGLVALHQQTHSPSALSAAGLCGERLLAHAQRTEHGVGWLVPNEDDILAGFAHGEAGIAWALLKLAQLTGDQSYRETALAAIAHERSLFSPRAANWRDLRTSAKTTDPDGPFMTAWCAGAPGIGLARLATLDQLDDDEIRREIGVALNTTIHEGFGYNQSLCHGDLGNLELLLQAGHVLNEERWHSEAYRLARPIAESVSRDEYACGNPLAVDTPGLMTGLAGIGYGLLRLAAPARVPSVLTLEAPVQHHAP